MNRRQFLKRTAQAAAALSTAGAFAAERVPGANDRVRVGLIGCGGRGLLVARLMREAPNVEFAAVCDVFEPNARAAREWAGPGCRAFGDFRRLLEQRDLDAVVVATPDHWHAIPTVLACQAGKDVYVEKPLAHNVREGRAMVEAARRHRRIVQLGTQHRSAPHYAEVARLIRSGALGQVHFVRVWNYANLSPNGIGRVPDSPPPTGLDWDFYLGPAPKVPFNQNRFLRNYRWFWDYAGGIITDYGTHRFDSVHQVMGVDAPLAVTATGRRFALDDGAETPDVIQATYEYPGFILSYEGCHLNAHGTGGRTPGRKYYQMRGADDRPHGEAFYGTNGALFSDRIGFEIYPELKPVPRDQMFTPGNVPPDGFRMERREVAAADATAQHVQAFIESVRSRQKPPADVETGHRASIIGHLGNIACRTGHKLAWDAAKEEVPGDRAANALLGRRARKPWDLI
jgi:predicted dehydrogenase